MNKKIHLSKSISLDIDRMKREWSKTKQEESMKWNNEYRNSM